MDISGSRGGQAKTYNLNRAVGVKNREEKVSGYIIIVLSYKSANSKSPIKVIFVM